MTTPKRPDSHITETKAKKFLEQQIPDEWHFNIPDNDYGIDYQVEISVNNQVTGLNFSIQLKGHAKGSGAFAKATLKHSTLAYYKVRLEPVMIVVYEEDCQEAYWEWVDNLRIDLSKGQKEYTINVSRKNVLRELDWNNVIGYVQQIFSNRSFIGDFDISKIHDNWELAAWKSYNDREYEHAVYLFRRLIDGGNRQYNTYLALAWSLYQTYRYHEALNIVNNLTNISSTENILQLKACILAEYGFSDNDRGKIIQARNLFKSYLPPNSSAIIYYNYANTLSELRDYSSAIINYKISIDKDPNFAPCWKNLGTAYGHQEEFDEELRCYDVALSINPNLQEALFSKGVTLAKDFGKYEEALKYFNSVLSAKNNLLQGNINGLFWVAEAYEKTGDIISALHWIDYGLSFSCTNIYFLNFKSNLLARHWEIHPELKQPAEDFFRYRIELDNDQRSLYHLILLLNQDFHVIYPLLQEHTPLFSNVHLENLKSMGFNQEIALTTLLQMELYATFKGEHPTTRYVDHLISGYYSIGTEFWNLMDVVCSYAFNKGILKFGQSKSAVELSATIRDVLVDFLPRLIPFLIEQENDRSIDDIENIISTVYQNFPILLYREIGAQSGFLSFHLQAAKVDPSEYISEEQKSKFDYDILYNLYTFFGLSK